MAFRLSVRYSEQARSASDGGFSDAACPKRSLDEREMNKTTPVLFKRLWIRWGTACLSVVFGATLMCGEKTGKTEDASVGMDGSHLFDSAWPDDDAGSQGACQGSSVIPATLDLGGEPSAVAVADLDRDGCKDLVALTVQDRQVNLVVAWGDPEGAWSARWLRPLQGSRPYTTRDTSSHLMALDDLDGDGWPDVLTAAGVVAGRKDRQLSFSSFPGGGANALLPVALVKLSGSPIPVLVRATFEGGIDVCQDGACEPLDVPYLSAMPATDLVSGDFDHDGYPDLLAGWIYEDPYTTWIWKGAGGWTVFEPVSGMHCKDLQVGDVDGDGFPDVVSQRLEYISDFPSDTDVWCSRPSGFELIQVLYNHDNHNDAAFLGQVDGAGCVDYLQIGVDIPQVGMRRGDCQYLGVHEPSREKDVGWEEIPAVQGIGVQCLDMTGDGICEIIIRGATDGLLHLFSRP